jgi:3-oxoadipate enol-lactonase
VFAYTGHDRHAQFAPRENKSRLEVAFADQVRFWKLNVSELSIMKTVNSEDAQLRCEHAPRPGAPALLFINSLGASLEMWDDQADVFGERFELIRYDARGHGQSTAGAQSEFTLEQLARDAIAILDSCGIARAHLCGISLGGMTAMTVAQRWPDRVLKLALCNTSTHMPPKETWQTRIQSVLSNGMADVTEATLERWFTPEYRQAQPEKIERVRQMLLRTDPRGYAACSAAIRDMDLRETISTITARTLVIAGSQDPATPPAHAQYIAEQIPEAKLVTLDCAHLSNIECAAEFNSALLEFLAAERNAST